MILNPQGKGQSDTQAKVSCLGEAIERYSCCHTDDIDTHRGTFAGMGAQAIHPNAVQQFSEAQFAHRDEINRDSGTFNQVPQRFSPNVELSWSPLWSLTKHRTRWLPTAMCYFNYDSTEGGTGPRFASCNSNGCASGNTLEEAILQGLFELIERDAVALWWYNRLHRPGVDLASFDDAFIANAQSMCAARGRTLQVIDLTSNLGIPVFVSVSAKEADGGMVCLGFGCHLDPRLAISRAITEMFQMLSRDEDLTDVRSLSDDPEYINWFENVTLQTDPYLAADPAATTCAETHTDQSSDDIAQDVQFCVDRLAESGLETLVLNHTRPYVGFPTARVVVPGLRHFWSRFAPGRLFEVPVAMGWRETPLAEDALNPNKFIW
ncbi:YcaO-like family protein [Ruegeria sp. 2012CJ41-6]|uniref:YcaO-like family protein n=1 Tax=Ruegeria spongiae TaxID=2942209 RepID=A0ABT0Q1M3_9RHOB|nr:YcaO-like family protein [Ruegeria spongiae]MCL6283716.1 YcaO-like family protein [Ruegeria spongiae]